MPSAEEITQTVNRYIGLMAGGRADQLAELYAEHATIEDPIGSGMRHGRESIREFYAVLENVKRESELVLLRVVGNEAAYHLRLVMTLGDNRSEIKAIGVMTFDDDARIESMRAYWTPADITAIPG
jgi:steroid Delta-isomerase